MNRYLIDAWHGPEAPRNPLECLRLMHANLRDDLSDILDWLVAMEIDHHYTVVVTPRAYWAGGNLDKVKRAYLMIPLDTDAFSFRMAWNILPIPHHLGPEDEEHMAIERRLRF